MHKVVHHRGAAPHYRRAPGCRHQCYETRGAMTQITTPPAFDPVAASTAYRNALDVIAAVEPDVASAMRQELTDQRESLKLIASENYASPAVLLAMGSWLSDKYAEVTIGHRFYA